MNNDDIRELDNLIAIEESKPSRDRRSYRARCMKTAKQLGYSLSVVKRIKNATSDIQIEMIMLGEAKRSNLERDKKLGRC